VILVGLDIGHKALARDPPGCLAEDVLISLWKGIEMSFGRQLENAISRYRIYGDGSFLHRPAKPEQGYAWNTRLVRPQPDE
jgi:hypothetical protein